MKGWILPHAILILAFLGLAMQPEEILLGRRAHSFEDLFGSCVTVKI